MNSILLPAAQKGPEPSPRTLRISPGHSVLVAKDEDSVQRKAGTNQSLLATATACGTDKVALGLSVSRWAADERCGVISPVATLVLAVLHAKQARFPLMVGLP